MKPATIKKFVLFMAFGCLTLAACSSREMPDGNTPEQMTGTIAIFSAGETYAPLENWIFSKEENGPAADGARKQPQEVADELPAIPCGDDFQIVIDGEPQRNQSYTLYNDKFEQIYYRQSNFAAPRDEGEYILFVELVWGDEENYTGYQYCFKLAVVSPQSGITASSQSEAPQNEMENTSTASFALGANRQDEKTMGIGDQIGDWKLVDLQIQYHDESINMLEAIFEGNVTLNGTISRNGLVDYGFDFEVSKEDEVKMPYYIAPEMTRKDRFMFMLNFADDINGTVKLEHGEQINCKITINDYRFIFAYMTAPASATVVDIEIQ